MPLPALEKKKLLGEYHIGKTIGEGAFSKVKLGYHKESNQKVAVKIIDKKMIEEQAEKTRKEAEEKAKKRREREEKTGIKEEHEEPLVPAFISGLQLEVQLLMRLNHPNVIRLYQVIETDEECYVVMEYASGGELLDHLTSKGRLQENEARKYFRQLISAMDHCHLANVVHRDLKLENLLLNSSKGLLISDFGLGRTFSSDNPELMRTFCGTPNYAAVELISGIPYVGVKSDIWAMGVVLFILASGDPPFYGSNLSSLYARIKAVDYRCPSHFSKDLRKLLAKMLVKDPNKRCTMDDLRADPWVNQDENEPPIRVMPKVAGSDDVSQISQFIAGITKERNAIVYTLHKHGDDRNSQTSASPSPIKSKLTRKQSTRIIQAPITTISSTESGGAEDEVAPLGARRPSVLAKGGPGGSFRGRRTSSASPGSRVKVSSSSDYASPADRPTQVMRRMSSVGPAPAPIESPDVTSAPAGNHRRASTIGNTIISKPAVPAPDQVGATLVKSPSQIVDDPDPFEGDEENITAEELEDWHSFHRPPKEVRTVRFSFSSNTTSLLSPAIIFRELHRVLLATQETTKSLTIKRVDEYYMINCTTAEYGEDPIHFEVEVCKVWMLKMHGLRFKRIAGDPFAYKRLYEEIVGNLEMK